MNKIFSTKLSAVLVGALLIGGCASYGGSSLQPGVSSLPEVLATMGEPAMLWTNPDGSKQLAYPRGPLGTQSFMAYLDADQKLQRIDKVLEMAVFARIQTGMSKEQVLRLIGPPQPQSTQYFKARDELAWSWLFCDSWNTQAFLDVLFDASSGTVRSVGQRPNLVGRDGIAPSCGH
ncbi:hypothetical protein [Undibacterium sp. Ren11W]|uniref:hypothetical protein n=1 Tax=Undibacterium sp. Ren11W TaxID=3413045 RepID=UPI003BF1819E